MSASIEVDQTVIDFLLGEDSEGRELVEGSHLFNPSVRLEQVILPDELKHKMVRLVDTYTAFARERKRSGLSDTIEYGTGQAVLLYGPSGVGKTMFVHALCTHAGRPLLLANFSRLNAEGVRAVFRIARLHNAFVLFDEAEGIFRSRSLGGDVQAVLTEMERFEGLCFLATNRPQEIDDAIESRLMMKVALHRPDAEKREQIFRVHLPPEMRIDGDIDFARLAWKYELTGRLIKNAIVLALALAVSRDPENARVCQDDLEEACRRQQMGRLQMTEFEGRVIPRVGLNELVTSIATREAVEEVIGLEKSRRTLEQWGLNGHDSAGTGVIALFVGPPGTGKSRAAEVVAYELMRPLRRVRAATLVSKWVGETGKNLMDLFAAELAHEAVLQIDEADALLAGRTAVASSTDRYANADVGTLLAELERYPGVVVFTSNLKENIDPAFLRRMRVVVEFPEPDLEAREGLWRLHLPKELPLAEDVDIRALAAAFPINGGGVHNAVRAAASRAALRVAEGERRVRMGDLLEAARREMGAGKGRAIGFTA